MAEARVRAVSFYLPQFHPIPENDEWWGPGFTEWTNTARARPLFPGHRQPHLPADLGFYDLRLPEAREAQSRLAKEHGIEAFCYWHYWFGAGERILERPFTEVLESGSPDISFCLAWANQTWTGIWHAAADKILREQRYLGHEDDQAHFDTVVAAFRDPRYLRVDGRPVFYVFRPEQLPDPAAFVDRWQLMATTAGLPGLFLVAEMSDLLGRGAKYDSGKADGFDASVYVRIPARQQRRDVLRMKILRKLGGPETYPYTAEASQYELARRDRHVIPCVYPNWDNSPRSGKRGLALTGSTPQAFAAGLRNAVDTIADRPLDERLVWIKSWNEWAEGNYLEPDLTYGRGWLQAAKQVLLSDD
jgi:Glycosyltransferase WbsX